MIFVSGVDAPAILRCYTVAVSVWAIRWIGHYRCRQGCVATIGNFDGLHRGHRHVIGQVQAAARAAGLSSVAMVFEPQPSEYFLGERAPGRLMTLADKLDGLRDWGMDAVLCVRFDQGFAEHAPRAFIQTVLVDGLHGVLRLLGRDAGVVCLIL